MLPTGCFEAGRFSKIQTSRTAFFLFPQMDVWLRYPVGRTDTDRQSPNRFGKQR